MKERYLDLTPRQTEVLGQIAIGFDQWHHPKTLEVLARKVNCSSNRSNPPNSK